MPQQPDQTVHEVSVRPHVGHAQHRHAARCPVCAYPLYFQYLARGVRRSCTRCRNVFYISDHDASRGVVALRQSSFAMPPRATRSRSRRHAAGRSRTATVAGATALERRFGVELEIQGLNQSAAAAALVAGGIDARAESYSHSVPSRWKVVTDGSVGYGGSEVVSPPLRGEAGLNELRRVCEILTAAGATISPACGLHVHVECVDLSDAARVNVVKYYARHEAAIDSFMPKSRRAHNNNYCQPTPRTGYRGNLADCRTMADLRQLFGGSRYVKLNVQSFARQGTFEVRHHAGSTDADKVSKWVLLLLEIFSDARVHADGSLADGTLDSLLDGRSNADFFRARAAHFAAREARAARRPQAA